MCVFVCMCICVFTYMYVHVHICLCIFYSIFIIIVLCCVGVMDLLRDVSLIKFELNLIDMWSTECDDGLVYGTAD